MNAQVCVTADDVEDAIASEHYFTAADGLAGANVVTRGGLCVVNLHSSPPQLGLLTICVLVMRNGFTVLGKSVCASLVSFDAEDGRRIARQHAVAQLVPLLVYALRERIASGDGS